MSGGFNQRTFQPPGPVGENFLRSDAEVRGLMGPIGSGKTNVCFFDGIARAARMPTCTDGVKRWRGIVMRDTYVNLWKTTIPTWHNWFPRTMGDWTGADGRQAQHKLRFDMPDKSVAELELWFLALQESNVEDLLKGLEFNWFYLNEFDRMDPAILTFMLGRVLQRRYPPKRMLPAKADYYVGGVVDFNPPDTDSHCYKLFEEEKPEGHVLFKQPSGRSPQGENRAGVSLKEYEDIARLNAHRPDFVRRMVDGLWGYSREGAPVYTEYDDNRHVAAENLKPLKGVPLRLGFDQGITGPAMVVAQFTYSGQLRVLREFVPGRMGPTAFGRQCRFILDQEFAECNVISATCDLAGFTGADTENGDLAWAQTVSEHLGITLMPAPTNELAPRMDGVRQLLTHSIERQPAFLLSPGCKMLRKGFNSHYRYKKIKCEGDRTSPKPEKNEFSNPHDALQYLVLDIFGLHGVIRGEPGGEGGRRHGIKSSVRFDDDDDDGPSPVASSNFDVFKI